MMRSVHWLKNKLEKTCDKSKVFRMMNENRIKYFSPADYTEGSQLASIT